MKQIDFISLHRHANFLITDGPHEGKFCQVMAIDFQKEIVETSKETILPASILKPILRTWADLSPLECLQIYDLYFQQTSVKDFSGDTGSANFMPKLRTPIPDDICRIINGQDWSQGDWTEILSIINYCIPKNIDVFGGIEKGYAVHQKSIKS